MASKTNGDKRWTANRQGDVATALGVSVQTVANWASQGMPGKPGAYSLPAIVKWLRSEGPWSGRRRIDQSEADPLLAADGDSPGLERYRQAKAALAELDLAERKGALLAKDKARGTLGRWANIIRKLGERLQKRYGPDAALEVNYALAECQHVIDHDLSGNGTSDDNAAD